MAPRFWTGYLRLSLVTCPVALQPATSESEKVRFHTLNKATSQKVISRYVDAITGEPVDDYDIVKGFAIGDDRYVTFEDDELLSVGLESARTIDIDMFVANDTIPWIYLDAPYFLTPDEAVGEEAFAVIREAMSATSTVGISRVVLNRRERAVMLEPRGKGIIAWTLRFGDEVRKPGIYFGDIRDVEEDPKLGDLADDLVARNTKHWSSDFTKDPIQEHLLKLIATKAKRSVKKDGTSTAPPQANVVNLFEALRKSLQSDFDSRKRS